MSRRRNQGFVEAGQTAEFQMDSPGGEALLELEADEELMCSVGEITQLLGRNITAAMEAALSEIRKVVSARTRLLQTELRQKSEEIELLRARLEPPRRSDLPQAAHKAAPAAEPRRAKPLAPAVKKENIDAICHYLMKDKNLRVGPEACEQQQQQQALSPWTESEDIFTMLPSGSKRLYDYEWMAGVELNATNEFKAETDSQCESAIAARDTDDENSAERTGAVSDVSEAPFPLDPHDSPGQDRSSPLNDSMDRLEQDEDFSSTSFICPFCGTLCPDSLFLEEHLKLMHQNENINDAHQSGPSSSGGLPSEGEVLRKPGCNEPSSRERKVEGGYECGDCGRHFNYLGNLRQHRRIHTGEKPFACPDCGECFRHAARLKSHRLTHSGNQSPFPCPQCGKGFPVLSGLKRHQRVHTGESPYACPQCGRRFKELGNLYTHMRIHSGATPYTCYQCGRSFRHLGTYKSHRCTPATQVSSGHSPAWLQEDNVQTD